MEQNSHLCKEELHFMFFKSKMICNTATSTQMIVAALAAVAAAATSTGGRCIFFI
jgi:hypothetical protein